MIKKKLEIRAKLNLAYTYKHLSMFSFYCQHVEVEAIMNEQSLLKDVYM